MSKFKVGDIVLPTGKIIDDDYDFLKDWLEKSPLGIGRVENVGEIGEEYKEVMYDIENPRTGEPSDGVFYESELRLLEQRSKNGRLKKNSIKFKKEL